MGLNCRYSQICSGCDYLDVDYAEQKNQKVSSFREKLATTSFTVYEVGFQSFGEGGLRSRLDFGWAEGKLGLYQKQSRELIDIEECPQLEPALQSFLENFRQIQWPISKGSIRLRVNSQGQKGAWLDFANVDIKKLLEERSQLEALREMAFVEMGQKHKSLIQKKTGDFGLGDPVLNPWFETWFQDQPVPLFSTVASFTQPSLQANRGLTKTIANWMEEISPRHVLEFGSGIGNLTFTALSTLNTHVTATDIDERALQGLRMSLEKMNLTDRVSIQCGDFRSIQPRLNEKVDTLLLNPARNGVGKFLDHLLPLGPQNIIYMSCYPESFFLDIQKLHGYKMKKVELVDQFPQTRHVEILSLFEKI